jgi:hypothetical protein
VLTAVVYLWGVHHRLLRRVRPTVRWVLDVLIVVGVALLAAAAHLRPF